MSDDRTKPGPSSGLMWRKCVCGQWYWGSPQDPAQAAPPSWLDVDVMRLRRALERGLAAVDDEWTIEELAELSAAEYALLAKRPDS